MSTFLVSFRIEHEGNYAARYAALNDAIKATNGMFWDETTSFYVKTTTEDISAFTARLKKCINVSCDVLLVLDAEVKSGRISGAFGDQDIFKLMPFVKNA